MVRLNFYGYSKMCYTNTHPKGMGLYCNCVPQGFSLLFIINSGSVPVIVAARGLDPEVGPFQGRMSSASGYYRLIQSNNHILQAQIQSTACYQFLCPVFIITLISSIPLLFYILFLF